MVLPIADREKDYRCQFELLLNPSIFPTEKLEMKELLSIYYPNSETTTENQATEIKIRKEIVDKLWQNIRQEVLELVQAEIKSSPDEEETEGKEDLSPKADQLAKLAFKLTI